jgi:hypothetical protein
MTRNAIALGLRVGGIIGEIIPENMERRLVAVVSAMDRSRLQPHSDSHRTEWINILSHYVIAGLDELQCVDLIVESAFRHAESLSTLIEMVD